MTKRSYAQSDGLALLQEIMSQAGPIFTINEARTVAEDAGISTAQVPLLLHRLATGAWIARLKQGVYILQTPLLSHDTHPYAIAQALLDPMAISHWSALAHHGLTTQIPPVIQASTPRSVVTPQTRKGKTYKPRGYPVWQVLDLEVEFIHVKESHYFGHRHEWVDRWHRVPITDLERTVLDMIAHPRVFGTLQAGLETTEEHLLRLDIKKLIAYGLRYNVGAVIKRLGWILAALGVSEELLMPLEDYPTKSYSLLDITGPQTGKAIARWKLYNNLAG